MNDSLKPYMIPGNLWDSYLPPTLQKQVRMKFTTETTVTPIQKELQSILTKTTAAYISNFTIDSRIPFHLRRDFYLDMELFSQNLSSQVATTYVDTLDKHNIANKALSAAHQEIKSGMHTLSGKLNRYDQEFLTWLTLESYHQQGYTRFLFISEQGSNTCDLCNSHHGEIFSLSDVPIPPLHPNCRCELVLMDTQMESLYHRNERTFIDAFLQARSGPDGGIYILNHDTYPFRITADNLTRVVLPSEHIIVDRSNPTEGTYDLSTSVTSYLSQLSLEANDLITHLVNAHRIRSENKWNSFGHFVDWLTLGIVSGTWRGFVSNYDAMISDPSLYNIVNFLTLGTLDTIAGALNPEEPWSLEHWLNIIGTLLTAYAAYSIATGVKQTLTGSIDDAMRAPGTFVDDIDDVARSAGLTKEQINAIIKTPKGQRPNPSTYLTQEYIDHHLEMFQNGVTKFSANPPTSTVGPPDGTFVCPSSFADDIISRANGDISALEQLLGFDSGYFGNAPVRIDIPNPRGLRVPSGNEIGANEFWLPGGYTSGGIPEAIIDQPKPGDYVISSVFQKGG